MPTGLQPARKRRTRLPKWTASKTVPTIALKSQSRQEFSARPKLQKLVKALGLNVTAKMLDVDRGQLSRSVRGHETINEELARRVSDVEYVLDRALKVMWPDEIGPWLISPEPLLGSSIPLNVLILSGPARVIDAIDARVAGAYA